MIELKHDTQTADTAALPVAPRLVAIDETEYWVLDDCPHREWIERIECVYLWDNNLQTFCCSFTPSAWMEIIEYREVLKEAVYDRDDADDIREAVNSWVMQHADWSEYGCYMDFHDADKFTNTVALADWPIEEGETRESTFEQVREYCSCNSQI